MGVGWLFCIIVSVLAGVHCSIRQRQEGFLAVKGRKRDELLGLGASLLPSPMVNKRVQPNASTF